MGSRDKLQQLNLHEREREKEEARQREGARRRDKGRETKLRDSHTQTDSGSRICKVEHAFHKRMRKEKKRRCSTDTYTHAPLVSVCTLFAPGAWVQEHPRLPSFLDAWVAGDSRGSESARRETEGENARLSIRDGDA